MKIALCALSILCAPTLTLLAVPDSAYQALRVVGAQRGQDALNHVIEVQGRNGIPQPTLWRVVLDDPSSRGGVRELDVARGKVVAEHTPVRAYGGSAAGAVVDFHKLNLDSGGVFTVAEKEAQKSHIGFDSVDYTLRTGDGADAGPVWVLNLMDGASHSVGAISVAADTGAIVSNDVAGRRPAEQYSGPPPPNDYVVQETDHDNVNVDEGPPPPRRLDPDDTEDTQGLRVGHRIKHAFITAGSKLQNFFERQFDHQ